jgi:hypothetical protein
MKPPHNDSIWPDDTQRAAVTLALAAATNSGMQFHDVINSITDALNSGRPLQCQAHEDDMRSRGEWRNDQTPPSASR